MSPPKRILIQAEPADPQCCAEWLAEFAKHGISNQAVYLHAQAILGFEIESGSHRKYAVPVEEVARLMAVTVKTALKFIKPGTRLGRGRQMPAVAAAAWAASKIVESYLEAATQGRKRAWLDALELDERFSEQAHAFNDWFNRIFSQPNLPGFSGKSAALPKAKHLRSGFEFGRQYFRARTRRGYIYCFAYSFESWAQGDARLEPFLAALSPDEILSKLTLLDEDVIRERTEEGSEVCFPLGRLEGSKLFFAPLIVSWKRDPREAAVEIRNRLLAMNEMERFWATSNIESLGNKSLAKRLGKHGEGYAVGWVRNDLGHLSVQFHTDMSPHAGLMEMAMGPCSLYF